MLEARDVV